MGKSTEDQDFDRMAKDFLAQNAMDTARETLDAVDAADGYPPSNMPVTLRLRHGFGRPRPGASR
jgi:hypothetical protein